MEIIRKFHDDVMIFQVKGIFMIGNFRTGSFIGLNQDGLEFVNAIKAEQPPTITVATKELDKALSSGGYYEKNIDKIYTAYFHVTDRCNLHCIGCYSFIENRNCKNDLTLEKEMEILDKLWELGIHNLVISGGEPFLRNDLKEICQYASEKGIIVDVISNGTQPIDKYIPVLPYISKLNISIDGYDENTFFIRDQGIMTKVLQNIKILANKTKVHLIITLHNKNIDFMKKYKDLATDLSVTFNFSLLTAAEDNEDFKDYILDDADLRKIQAYINKENIPLTDTIMDNSGLVCRNRCGVGKSLISIAADGTVYPCHMLHIPELAMGNVLQNNLRDIVFSQSNEFLSFDVDDLNECQKCYYRYFCGGGCRARSYLKYHTIKRKCDLCETNYNFIEENINKLKNAYGLQ